LRNLFESILGLIYKKPVIKNENKLTFISWEFFGNDSRLTVIFIQILNEREFEEMFQFFLKLESLRYFLWYIKISIEFRFNLFWRKDHLGTGEWRILSLTVSHWEKTLFQERTFLNLNFSSDVFFPRNISKDQF